MKNYYERYVLRNNKLETVKVPKKIADKQINAMIKENKILFDILAKF